MSSPPCGWIKYRHGLASVSSKPGATALTSRTRSSMPLRLDSALDRRLRCGPSLPDAGIKSQRRVGIGCHRQSDTLGRAANTPFPHPHALVHAYARAGVVAVRPRLCREFHCTFLRDPRLRMFRQSVDGGWLFATQRMWRVGFWEPLYTESAIKSVAYCCDLLPQEP